MCTLMYCLFVDDLKLNDYTTFYLCKGDVPRKCRGN
jgi:hypothetical protein